MYALLGSTVRTTYIEPEPTTNPDFGTKRDTSTGRGLEQQGGSNPSIGVPGDVRRGDGG